MSDLPVIPVLILFLLLVILILLAENYRELHSFQVVEYKLKSDKVQENTSFHFVFLSDLHNHQYGNENVDLLEKIKTLKPDFILIGGDMITRTNSESYDVVFPFLEYLSKIAPVYYALGNHEQKLRCFPEKYQLSYDDFQNFIETTRIRLLINKRESLRCSGNHIGINGLEIPVEWYDLFHKAGETCEELQSAAASMQEAASFEILLAHNPKYMKQYLKTKPDLILSGHLHGGVLRIPAIGGVIAPDLRLFPKYSGGYYKEDNCNIITSHGLGTHSVPIRINCPSQLIHVTVESA